MLLLCLLLFWVWPVGNMQAKKKRVLISQNAVLVATVGELPRSRATRNLMRDQLEIVLLAGQLHQAGAGAAPRSARGLHHGADQRQRAPRTPEMAIDTAAMWELEGYSDSLAYGIAPLNVKITIVQSNKDMQTLINRVIPSAPHGVLSPSPERWRWRSSAERRVCGRGQWPRRA